ncbi:ATP-binding cassette domain-containing protein [Kribbella sp. NBC_00382]|uniref:ABC transporter ATP-binding protein n=1 Tax=Kribbella sp. NBC_00382 TaxID=2975967 RepID=UPI002E23761D
MIVADRITKAFGPDPLWSELSFTVEQGEMLALTGPSGAGKSTLLNCLGLLERVDSGTIRVGDQTITNLRAGGQRRFRSDTLGYLFQNYALIENATVDANLAIAGRREAFAPALQAVGLAGRGQDPVYRLSGGEQQRLAVARLLVKKPTVVLADEPTAALDTDNTDLVLTLLRRLAEDGCAVVIATHSKEVEGHCDNTLTL